MTEQLAAALCCVLALTGCAPSTEERIHSTLNCDAQESLDFVADTVWRASRFDHHGIAAQIRYRTGVQLQNPRWDSDILHLPAAFRASTDRTKWEGSGKYAARACAEMTVDKEAVLQPALCPQEDFRRGEFGVPVEYTLLEMRSTLNGPHTRDRRVPQPGRHPPCSVSAMGILKRLFGGKEAPTPEPRPATPPPPVERPAAVIPGHRFETTRQQAPNGPVDWPIDPESGLVFDDEWLLTGLKKAVNANQYASKLEGREDSAARRRERLFKPGLDGHDQRVEMLRGRDWLEWSEHVSQMKREGYLECALALVYEMMDTARGSAFWGHTPPPGWYNEAAVILRKLKDYDSEVRILEEALQGYPGSERFSTRREKAKALQLKV